MEFYQSSLKLEIKIFFTIWLCLSFILSPMMFGLSLTPEIISPQAQATIPTIDWAHIGTSIYNSAQEHLAIAWETAQNWARDAAKWVTEKAWDLAKSAAKAALKILLHQILAQITNSIIKWIQSDFQGQPGFITDWNKYLSGAANAAAGRFLNTLAGVNLCSAFKPKINILFALPVPRFNTQATCTLDGILSNVNATIDDFYKDFSKGGWVAWEESLKTNNDAFGTYLMTLDTKRTLEFAEIQKKEKESKSGFKGTKRCLSASSTAQVADVSKIDPDSKDCASSITTMPDGTVAYNVNFASNSAMQVLQNEISNLIGEGTGSQFSPYILAITNALITQLVKDGISGLLNAVPQKDNPDPSTNSVTISTNSDTYTSITTDAAEAQKTLTHLSQLGGTNSLVSQNKSQLDGILSTVKSIRDTQNKIITNFWGQGNWTKSSTTATITSGPTTSTSGDTTTVYTIYSISNSQIGEASIGQTKTTVVNPITGTSTTTFSYSIISSKNQIEDINGIVTAYQNQVNTLAGLITVAPTLTTTTNTFIGAAAAYASAWQSNPNTANPTAAQTARTNLISQLQNAIGSTSNSLASLNTALGNIITGISTNTTGIMISITNPDGTVSTQLASTYYQDYYNAVIAIYNTLRASSQTP